MRLLLYYKQHYLVFICLMIFSERLDNRVSDTFPQYIYVQSIDG